MLNNGLMSSNSNEWATPNELFDELNSEFNFTLDPCCTHKNAKCKKHYTINEDGLAQSWKNESVFCNPPYGTEIKKWVKKCYEEHIKNNITVVMLIPARTDTTYFHEYIYKKSEIRFIKGRVKFIDENGNQQNSAPFSSMIVIWQRI